MQRLRRWLTDSSDRSKVISAGVITGLAALAAACPSSNESPRMADVPQRMIWAWERPEDIRSFDPGTYGVAFLAQTVTLSGGEVSVRSRRQPLEVHETAYVMAVTRIETSKDPGNRPAFSDVQAERISYLVNRTIKLGKVKAVQIDFDAVVSERPFYRSLLKRLRTRLPENVPLSITSLASWCVGDRWLGSLPVDEVVPMAFEMGADDKAIRKFLNDGNDWKEPMCRNSYGLLAGDPLLEAIDDSRRIYFFNTRPWKPSDLERMQ